MDRASSHPLHYARVTLLTLICTLHITLTDGIQCYSCKAQGSNEIDANIRCLENAYLENCDEFYQYYNDVEDQKNLPVYDYYYYDEQELPAVETKGSGKRRGGGGSKAGGAKGRGGAKSGSKERSEVSREKQPLPDDSMSYREPKERSPSRTNRQKRAAKKAKKEEEPEYEYEYYDEDEVSNATTASPTKPKPTEKRKPEHFCYSMISKTGWEGYTVEKGCKKIAYCKNALAKKPEWMQPWNFCCDRSRCNVKLVKDKPQRVFGMGCRRTDDCIQGHTSRPVCPNFFKSCPRLSNSLVKMECRVKGRTMASVKNGAKYRYMFREKKCYCSKGYYPRGPICTNSSKGSFLTSSLISVISAILATLLLGNTIQQSH